ncbi:zinc finger, RING/FYVE/PHD-type [Artemisia annua]|uniref:Zinc finger, RING/FYVE/PHD-type n=1 Tax=Artemisia annua TaxID=35608 RepID=A0A2U1NU81_ARTAN|nr:zinc finger, RING/FYVE/PHD-type [Artemisia annua]
MICLVYDGYGASTATLVFFTCIWVPFVQSKNAFYKIISILMTMFFDLEHRHQDSNDHYFPNIYHLRALLFRDLATIEDNGNASRVVDEVCSICLVEFEEEDEVSQLDKCRHVFHSCCIERWLERDHFTCPLCRSNLLNISCKRVE